MVAHGFAWIGGFEWLHMDGGDSGVQGSSARVIPGRIPALRQLHDYYDYNHDYHAYNHDYDGVL